MEFFSKVARRPVQAGRLLVGLGESAWEEKPRKGKEQGAAMGPTNLDVTADAAHSVCLSVCPPAHFILLGGHSVRERAELADWQELAESRASHSHGLRMWETGALDWDYRD